MSGCTLNHVCPYCHCCNLFLLPFLNERLQPGGEHKEGDGVIVIKVGDGIVEVVDAITYPANAVTQMVELDMAVGLTETLYHVVVCPVGLADELVKGFADFCLSLKGEPADVFHQVKRTAVAGWVSILHFIASLCFLFFCEHVALLHDFGHCATDVFGRNKRFYQRKMWSKKVVQLIEHTETGAVSSVLTGHYQQHLLQHARGFDILDGNMIPLAGFQQLFQVLQGGYVQTVYNLFGILLHIVRHAVGYLLFARISAKAESHQRQGIGHAVFGICHQEFCPGFVIGRHEFA